MKPVRSLDITFCMNRECPYAQKEPICGRSIVNLDGGHFIVSMSSFQPDADGFCKFREEPASYVAPAWMITKAKHYEFDLSHERIRRNRLQNANSLDADDLDREV